MTVTIWHMYVCMYICIYIKVCTVRMQGVSSHCISSIVFDLCTQWIYLRKTSFFLYHVISCLSVELSCFEFILLKLFFLHVDVYAVI